MTASRHARVSLLPDVIIREVDGEALILNIKTERYFGLDGVGTRMFQVLQRTPSVGDALTQLADEYDVEPAVLSRDLNLMLDQLSTHGLIEVVDEPEAAL